MGVGPAKADSRNDPLPLEVDELRSLRLDCGDDDLGERARHDCIIAPELKLRELENVSAVSAHARRTVLREGARRRQIPLN